MGTFNAMRNFLIVFFGVCALSFGAIVDSVRIVASGGSPIPVANTVGDSQSEVLTSVKNRTHILIINDTLDMVAVVPASPDTDLAPAADEVDIYVPPMSAIALDGIAAGPRVYLRADDGSPLTSGEVLIKVW